MKLDYSKGALLALQSATPAVRRAFYKQARFLEQNLAHPSLRAKKFDRTGLWQARVNKDWRFYFTIHDDTYVIEKVIPHPK
jgi:mRNA interferase RelE/StbE